MEAVEALVEPEDGMVVGHGGDPTIADASAILAALPVASDDSGMIDQLRQLDNLKSLPAARQAEIAVAFGVSQRRVQAAAGFLLMSWVPGWVRSLRWRGGNPRLDSKTGPGDTAYRPDLDPDRPHLPLHSTPAARQ